MFFCFFNYCKYRSNSLIFKKDEKVIKIKLKCYYSGKQLVMKKQTPASKKMIKVYELQKHQIEVKVGGLGKAVCLLYIFPTQQKYKTDWSFL